MVFGKNNDKSPIRDTISSLCSGLTHVVKDVLGISFSILSYQYLVENLAVTHFQNTIVVCSIAFITMTFMATGLIVYNIDLIYYGIFMLFITVVKNLTLPVL